MTFPTCVVCLCKRLARARPELISTRAHPAPTLRADMASVAPTPYTYSPIPVPSGGEWKSPDFSLEARRSKVASTPILPISPSTLQQKHPDEEKGRSFRSSSSSQLLFAVTSDSNQQEEQGDGTIPFDELDDDGAFADLALADRAGLYETAFGLLPAFKHAPPVASTSFDWTTTLANAFDRIDGKLDVRCVTCATGWLPW